MDTPTNSEPNGKRPHRLNKTDHRPGAIVNDAKQSRRTPAQVKADAAEKKREEITKAQAEQAEHTAAIQRSAAKEDEIQQQELKLKKHAHRPDLRTLKLAEKQYFAGSSEAEDTSTNGLISLSFFLYIIKC